MLTSRCIANICLKNSLRIYPARFYRVACKVSDRGICTAALPGRSSSGFSDAGLKGLESRHQEVNGSCGNNNNGGNGGNGEPDNGPGRDEGPRVYPKWLQVWGWATAVMYLVVRTKWRLDKWQLRRDQEAEAAVQAQQDQEWQRFVEGYAAPAEGSAPGGAKGSDQIK